MNNQTSQHLLTGNIPAYIIPNTLRIFVGLMGLTSLSLADIYFIGKIGPNELMAVSFTAPVFLLGLTLLLSIGTAITTVIALAIGKQDTSKINKLSISSLALILLTGCLLMLFIKNFTHLIFKLLRVDIFLHEIIAPYLILIGIGFIPMALLVGILGIMRAYGETKIPLKIMVSVLISNLILDPILIFGCGNIIPPMQLVGAALATITAIFIGLIGSFFYLPKFLNINYSSIIFASFWYQWTSLLYLALPIAATRCLLPFSNGIITALLAGFGASIVAAYGIGYRVDISILMLTMALSSVIAPFVGQNFGAKNFNRIKAGIKTSLKYAVIYGSIMGVIVFYFRYTIATFFTEDTAILNAINNYLGIACWGYLFNGILMIATALLNALYQPLKAALVITVHLIGLYLPLSFLGNYLGSELFIYAAYPISNFLACGLALVLVHRTLS